METFKFLFLRKTGFCAWEASLRSSPTSGIVNTFSLRHTVLTSTHICTA